MRLTRWLTFSFGVIALLLAVVGLAFDIVAPVASAPQVIIQFLFLAGLFFLLSFLTTESASTAILDEQGLRLTGLATPVREFRWSGRRATLRINTFYHHQTATKLPWYEHIAVPGMTPRLVWVPEWFFAELVTEVNRRGLRTESIVAGGLGAPPGGTTLRIYWGTAADPTRTVSDPRAPIFDTDSSAETGRRLAWILGGVTFAGLGLVLASLLLPRSDLWYLAVPGFIILISGGTALLVLARRDMLRPVPTSRGSPQPPPSSSLSPFWGIPSEPLVLTEPATPPVLPTDDLTISVTFDLHAELARFRRQWRFQILFRMGGYIFLIALGGWVAIRGALAGSLVSVGLGLFLIAFGFGLFWFIRTLDRAVASVEVGPAGLTVEMVPRFRVVTHWDDPKFGLKIIETSAQVNQVANPSVPGPTFQLFTGSGSGMGRGQRVLTEIPPRCASLILAQARAHDLRVIEQVEGPAGTVSERHVTRVSPALFPGPS